MTATETTTRDRILNAAIARFSRNSYDDTGLRSIAEDVKVDVSYVHRCFGSKQALFSAALQEAVRQSNFFPARAPGLGGHLVRLILERRNDGCNAAAFEMLLCSTGSRDVKPLVREAVTRSFIEPFFEEFPDATKQEVAFAAALLVGIAACEDVLHLELFEGRDAKANESFLAEQVRRIFCTAETAGTL
ncbi:MAG: TetR family transcriptional regulator [Nitratireductor sp.]|nr:TetR family transcriptional regulator [Nitratireductor sp.]